LRIIEHAASRALFIASPGPKEVTLLVGFIIMLLPFTRAGSKIVESARHGCSADRRLRFGSTTFVIIEVEDGYGELLLDRPRILSRLWARRIRDTRRPAERGCLK
jgi:hypothetical protein